MPQKPGLAVAVAQMKARPGRLADSIAAHVEMARDAAESGASLVIFPELSLTGYSRTLSLSDVVAPEHDGFNPLQNVAREANITVVAGAPLKERGKLVIGTL